MIAQNQLSMAGASAHPASSSSDPKAGSRNTGVVKLRLHETIARYLLGAIYLHGAVDGALQIFFNVYYTGEQDRASFVGILQHTTYFWAFMKLCQLVGAFSLLVNYKPALGFALLAPVSAVLCLFYLFELQWYVYFALIAGSSLILLKAYMRSFRPLLDDYS